MKQLYTTMIALASVFCAHAQITLTQSDFAGAGDNILVSNADATMQLTLLQQEQIKPGTLVL